MSSSERPVHTGLLSGAACAGMFVFGIVMALLGAILPALSGRLLFGVADIGALFLAMNFAMLSCSLLLGLAMDRFGMKPPLALGPMLVAGALAAIVNARVFADLLPAVLLLGIGGGALNGATNTLMADLYDDPRRKSSALNILGVFFGFGALLLPFGLGALLASVGVDALLWSAALLCAAAGLFPLALRFPAPKQRHRLPVAEMRGFARSPLVLATAFLLFFQSGVEFTLGGYISTYLTREMIVSVPGASYLLAAYWGAVMAARVVLSRVLLRAEPHRLILLCAVAAFGGAAFTAIAWSPAVASVGIVWTGLALAGIFPTVLGVTGARFKQHSGTVFGILFTVALTGGMTMPWVAGLTANAGGLRWVFGLAAMAFGAIAVLSLVIARLSRAGAGE